MAAPVTPAQERTGNQTVTAIFQLTSGKQRKVGAEARA
jgi:hypothetical protein